MIKEKRYKIEIDTASPDVNVLKDVPLYRMWEFLHAHPEYKKYANDNCTWPLCIYKKCKVGSTALWKLVDALTYSMGGYMTNISRDAKDLKRNYGVNITSGMYRYLSWEMSYDKKLKMYKLNSDGESLRTKLRYEAYPMEALCKADRKQERLYQQAVEDAKKVTVDYYNWDIESSLESLK
jgi:hypothetical protein